MEDIGGGGGHMVFGKNRRGMITRLQQSVRRGLVGEGGEGKGGMSFMG